MQNYFLKKLVANKYLNSSLKELLALSIPHALKMTLSVWCKTNLLEQWNNWWFTDRLLQSSESKEGEFRATMRCLKVRNWWVMNDQWCLTPQDYFSARLVPRNLPARVFVQQSLAIRGRSDTQHRRRYFIRIRPYRTPAKSRSRDALRLINSLSK